MQAEAVTAGFPRVFGRYLLIDRLSRGGMGEIYLARVGEIEGFQKPCIIKKILPQLAADREFIQRFVSEAQIAIKLQHANVAQVYEVGLIDGDYFLALEFVDGRDLRSTLNRAREEGQLIPPPVGLHVVREVASGLGYAHRRTDEAGRPLGLVHCDVSPPNVLLGFEGEVKLIDFGIARSAVPLASDANVGFGKVGYMAPEQLGALGGHVDRRTDVYAAGVLLFELLTGERPFEFSAESSPADMAKVILEGAPHVSDRKPGLGRRFDQLVAKALAPQPEDRYASAEELRDAVQRQLVEMAPTFSADKLGHFVRELFRDEIGAGEPTAAARTADLRPYEKALDEARSHTVSFALSSVWTSPPAGHLGPTAVLGPAPGPVTPAPQPVPSVPPVRPRWRPWGAAAAAVVAVMAIVMVAVRSPPRAPAVSVQAPQAPRIERLPAPAPPPAPVPLAVPPVDAIGGAESSAPARTPVASGASRPHRKAAPVVPARREVVPLRRADVDSHYQRLRRLYAAYEKANGERLKAAWIDLQTWANYHDKDESDLPVLEQRLSAFEKRLQAH